MRLLIVLAGLAACYQPTVANCQYACGPGNACPDGQSCTNGFCIAPGETCTTGSDGSDVAPATPTGVSPANGVYTGSYLNPASLTPTFRWAAVANASYYELDLDPSCTVPSTCTFSGVQVIHATPINGTSYTPMPLPVPTAAPVGLRYGWRMRACNSIGCSDWTAARYLNVGRLRDDFNGDGISELAVGTYQTVAVRFYDYSAGSASMVLTCGPGKGETGFGDGIAVGDFNGDGYTDFAVTGYVATTDDITVIPGGPFTSDPCPDHEEQILGSGSNVYIGNEIAGVGDLDGDGYDDLVALEIEGTTRVLDVYFGTDTGLDLKHPGTIQLPMDPVSFSAALVSGTGDIDGDGYLDAAFAVGTYSSPESAPSAVAIVPGNPSRQLAATTMVADGGESTFGGSVAITDLDGDGLADVFVFAEDESSNPIASMFAYHASGSGLAQWGRFESSTMDSNFGAGLMPLIAGGAAELAITDGANPVTILGADLVPKMSNALDPNSNPNDDRFGASLGAGDYSGNGNIGLAVGATEAGNSKEGAVFVCPRTALDPGTGFSCIEVSDPDTTQNDSFGQALSP